MPRIAIVCAEGYPHHITQRGNNKEKVFFDNADKRFYLDVLKQYKNKYSMKVLAYCLMGNKEDKEIDATIRRATSTGRPVGSERFIKKLERILGLHLFPKKGGRPKRKK